MRYYGQGHEVVVTLPNRPLRAEDAAFLQARFDETYRQIYHRIIPNAEVEILTLGLTLATGGGTAMATTSTPAGNAHCEPTGVRTLFDGDTGDVTEIPTYWRPDLRPGDRVEGPALIQEEQTTTLVTGSFVALVAANGYIVMNARSERAP